MGVEHYIVCEDCKEYIDCHKAYALSSCLYSDRPPIGMKDDYFLVGGYWETRGVWFIWKHKTHSLKMMNDCDDNWYKEEPYLKEVFSHDDDIKQRENQLAQ